MLVELLMCLPFSTAVVERGFSLIQRILTDTRSTLSHNVVSDLLHICTQKSRFDDKRECEKLIQSCAEFFIKGSGEDEIGLSKRCINKVLNNISQEPLIKKMCYGRRKLME